MTGAFESTAPSVNIPFSSVSQVSSGVIVAVGEAGDVPRLELALAAAAAGRHLAGVDVVLLGHEQRRPRAAASCGG